MLNTKVCKFSTEGLLKIYDKFIFLLLSTQITKISSINFFMCVKNTFKNDALLNCWMQ